MILYKNSIRIEYTPLYNYKSKNLNKQSNRIKG